MTKTIIAEGKTTTEAISNGLKQLNVGKDDVDVKVIEEHEKRSFFSILAPRVVKVELTLKEDIERNNKKDSKEHVSERKKTKISEVDLENSKKKIEKFLKEFISNFNNLNYDIKTDVDEGSINIEINGEDSKVLIGHRGDVLNALQTIIKAVGNNNKSERARIILNISDYRERREKTLEDLAVKISKTVIKTGKSITLEPMTAYERKIIHSKLQSSNRVKTYSVGEEPFRKVVISKK